MLDVHFVFLGALFGIYGTYAYLRDTLRGVTQPNRVTWLLWAIAPLLVFAVQISEGVGLRSLTAFVIGIGPLIIFAASYFNSASVWKIGPLDWLCGALSAAALVVWLVTRHGTPALIVSIGADFLAGLPTVRKSWVAPETETVTAYWTAAANAGITVLTLNKFSTAEAAFPLFILGMASIQTVIVAGRMGRRFARSPSASVP